MTTEEDHAGVGPASNIGGGQLIGRSWSRSTDLGRTLHAAQPTQITGPAEHLLGLLSHSRPRPSTTSNTIVSRVIRLSQLRVEQETTIAVLKLARDLHGAEELRKQRQVITEIASHPGLDEDWRELLPQVLAFDKRFDATASVESYRPGIDLAEASRRGKSGMWRPSDTDSGFLSPEPLAAAASLALAGLKRFANVPRSFKYSTYCYRIEIRHLVCKDGNTRIAGISLPAATGAGPIAAPAFARRSTCRL
jgi:hypothetical protein